MAGRREAPLTPNRPTLATVHSPFVGFPQELEALDRAAYDAPLRFGRAAPFVASLRPVGMLPPLDSVCSPGRVGLWAPGLGAASRRKRLLRHVFDTLGVIGGAVHPKWRFVSNQQGGWDDAVERIATALRLHDGIVENALLVLFPLSPNPRRNELRAERAFINGSACVTVGGGPEATLQPVGFQPAAVLQHPQRGRVVRTLRQEADALPVGGGLRGRHLCKLADRKLGWLNGYPRLHMGRSGSKKSVGVRLHRFVLWAYAGLPSRARPLAMHACGCKACINPKHLFYGNASENGTKGSKVVMRVIDRYTAPRGGRANEACGDVRELAHAVERAVAWGRQQQQ